LLVRLSQIYHWTRIYIIIIVKSATTFYSELMKFSSRLQRPCFSKIILHVIFPSTPVGFTVSYNSTQGFSFCSQRHSISIPRLKNHRYKATRYTRVLCKEVNLSLQQDVKANILVRRRDSHVLSRQSAHR
jgi:hypothetical protein